MLGVDGKSISELITRNGPWHATALWAYREGSGVAIRCVRTRWLTWTRLGLRLCYDLSSLASKRFL